MVASELRIGNLVNRKYLNPNPRNTGYEYEPAEITLIRENSCNIKLKDGNKLDIAFKHGSISPIAITERWLLDFDFEKEFNNTNSRWEYFISRHGSNVIIEPFNSQWIFIWELNFVGRPIDSVHQLQNLYFALTGQELTIKD